MVKINYKSDFKINERSETVALEVPFVFSYYVFDKKKYVASFDGNTYVNCERKEDGSLDVIFNSPGFGVGRLKVERKYAVDDKAFADGVYDIVTVDNTDVFITSGKTFETYVETLVVPPYIKGDKGDKGDPMTWSGMTKEEQAELVQEVTASTQEAELLEKVTGNEKISVSDGTGVPKAITTEQIKNYIEESKESSSLEFVDLGLPSGTLWSSRNIGAEKPEDSGLFFAWGETEGYNVSYTEEGGQIVSTTIKDAEGNLTERKFTFADYKWSNGAWNSLTKYNTNSSYGVVDNLSRLLTDDDAAYAVNNTYRVPSVTDFEELIQYTTFSKVSIGSKKCGMFTAANGNYVIFPITGTVFDQISNVNLAVYYPTCEINSSHPSTCKAMLISNYSELPLTDFNSRCTGMPVRAVKSKETGGGTYDDTEIKAQIKENADNIAANKADADEKLSELGLEVGAIRKQFETFVPNSNIAPVLIWENGYIASDGTISTGQNHTYIDIPEGAEFLLTNARSVGQLKCVWLNGNTIISTFSNDNNNYKKILIPFGANRVGISNFSSNPLDSVFVIFNPTEIGDVIKSVESATYQYRLKDAIRPTHTSASGYRTYTYYSNGHTAAFFTGCVFTTQNNEIPKGIFTFYDINGVNLGENTYYNTFKGYILLPLDCSYFSLKCYYTSDIGYCFLAESKTNSLIGSIADNSNNINMLANKFEPFFNGKQILDDGAYINFSDKEVGKNMTNEQYDLGHEGVVFADGMSNLIVQPEGYVGGDNLQNSFYLTLKMKKNCTYVASTIIGTSSTDIKQDGVLIISDEQSRDGVTSRFHQRIVHVLLPNLNINRDFSLQLGDKDAEKEGKKRWNYEYSEATIEEVYSNITLRQVGGVKLLWEMFIEDNMLYIYLDHELVKIYRNVSDKNENVSNFSFSSLIPNANIGEVENCKVVDFAIGRRRQTYNSFVSLYNAKKYLL